MAKPAPTYDLTLLLDSAATDADRKKVLSDTEAMIGKRGEVVSTHDWGTRATTYEIDKKTDAEYHLVQFHGGPDLLEDLNRTLRITDAVLRFRVIKLANGVGDPPDLKSAPAIVPAPEATPEPEAPSAASYEPAADEVAGFEASSDAVATDEGAEPAAESAPEPDAAPEQDPAPEPAPDAA